MRTEPRLRGKDWLRILLSGLFLLALAAAFPVQAQSFPKLTGRVVDAANIIPADQKAALDAKLTAFQTTTGRQFVVATIPSLEGYPVEDYGYRLGRAWAIGDTQKDDGVILLVAPSDRKVRIEVGYGANVYMTDALSSVIINTQIVPQFKAGNYPAGIMAGADAIIEHMQLSPEEAEKRAQQAAQSTQGEDGSAAAFWLFLFFFFILPMIWPLFFGRKRGRRMGGGPVIIWGGGSDWGGGGGSSSGWGGGGGFSGGGGSFGGGGASGGW